VTILSTFSATRQLKRSLLPLLVMEAAFASRL
jgi:hypothetical protein